MRLSGVSTSDWTRSKPDARPRRVSQLIGRWGRATASSQKWWVGGAGIGWLIDRFANTTPLGLVSGLLIGTGFSIYVAVTGAARWAKTESEKVGSLPVGSDNDHND
jgi:hypothetical protein